MARILIVDDEEPMREIMVVFLERGGYECHHVSGGQDALKLLDAGEKFDLITTDISNYPMDGFTFRDALRRRYPDIPVLVITAAPDIGYSHYLSKRNAGPEEMVLAVRRALEGK
jgi:CheY-like chemotaxis protein